MLVAATLFIESNIIISIIKNDIHIIINIVIQLFSLLGTVQNVAISRLLYSYLSSSTIHPCTIVILVVVFLICNVMTEVHTMNSDTQCHTHTHNCPHTHTRKHTPRLYHSCTVFGLLSVA